MNAALLLDHYARIADAPDAIARLRRFVLDLAVRGKLVEQDASDEPVTRSLVKARIALRHQAETTARIRWKSTDAVKQAEVSKKLPSGWVAARVNDTGLYINGLAFKPSDWKRTGKPIIRIQNLTDPLKDFNYAEGNFADEVIVRNGDILVSWSATLEAFLWNRGEGVLNQHIFRVIPAQDLTDLDFLLILLRNAIREMAESEHAHGLVMTHINRGPFLNHIVLIPPMPEQRRIAKKFSELMALCDQLEAARAEREAARDTFTVSTLTKLDTADPETFGDDARFALANLAPLTTRPDQIKQLRQTILNLAMRGQLVEQDANDPSVQALLTSVDAARQALIHEGKAKRNKTSDLIPFESTPFDIPVTWRWVRMEALCELITKGSSPKWQGVNYVSADDGLLFITSENVGNHRLRKLNHSKYVERRFADIEPRSMLKNGDLLMNLVGASIGRTAIYDLNDDANINQAVAILRLVRCDHAPYAPFLLHYLNSPIAIDIMLGSRVMTAQPNISLKDARDFPVPIPPLAEQQRIVAKVDELMALCDQLEASITAGEQTRSRLLEAVLHDALEPA